VILDSGIKFLETLTENEIAISLTEFLNNKIEVHHLHEKNVRIASVLVPLTNIDSEWHLLYTKRTDNLRIHQGQISFPGGAIEPGDDNLETTALRETYEEISLKPHLVKILGRLPTNTSVTNYQITPVVGRILWPVDLVPNPAEVQKIFTIPLKWLAEISNREWRPYKTSGGRVDQVIYYRPYDGEVLWGITARITVSLLAALKFNK
jgi:8-oxo-dGTP pyrophosphatase MutT (NUDIX family)